MRLFRLLGFLAAMVSAGSTQAAFVFEISPLTSVGVGQTLSTDIFVTATGATDIAAFASLGSMSFNLSGTGSSVTISSWTKNAAFNLGAVSGVPSGTTLNQGLTLNLGGVAAVSGRVRLGTINFLGNTVGNTVFSFIDPSPAPADNVSYLTPLGASVSLDSQVFSAPSSFTVTAVPEPSTFFLIGLVGAGSFAFRRFRKTKTA